MLITDAIQAARPVDEIVTQTLDAGCKWVLLRDHDADDDEFLYFAEKMKSLCETYNAKCFISRNIVVAAQIEADGLHLSESQNIQFARSVCGDVTIGQSCHSLEAVLNAEKNGADYVSISPIFETISKPGYGPAIGLNLLQSICATSNVPVMALGGITANNAKSCLNAGAFGVAVMGEIMRSQTPFDTMRGLLNTL